MNDKKIQQALGSSTVVKINRTLLNGPMAWLGISWWKTTTSGNCPVEQVDAARGGEVR